MHRGLASFLIAILALAVVYGVVVTILTDSPEAGTRVSISTVSTAALVESMQVAIPTTVEPAAEFGRRTSPEITWTEFPGRRVVIEGSVSTAEERRKVEKFLTNVLPKETKVSNQLRLDQERTLFTWWQALTKVDLSSLQMIWNLKCQLSNDYLKVSGNVESQATGQSVLKRLAQALPEEIELRNDLEAGERPKPSISVWMAPDMTYLLTGSVPEGHGEAILKLVKRSTSPGALVVNDLIENRFAQQPIWLEEMRTFLPGFLKETQRSSFSIDRSNRVKIEGIATSAAIPGIRRRFVSAFPASKFKVETDLKLGIASDTKIVERDRNASFQELVATSKIYFNSGRSRASQLTTDERAKLDRLGQQWLNENVNQKVYVFGFTDASGDPQTNAYVSKSRCENVVGYLAGNFGIDRSYFEVVGTPEGFVPDPKTDSNELRRVEFSLTNQPSESRAGSLPGVKPRTVLKAISIADLLESTKIIYFDKSQVTPSKADRKQLADLASALVVSGATDNLVLYGYSDDKGSADANRWFTEERCREVAKVLKNGGIPESQIVMRPVIKPRALKGDEDLEPEVPVEPTTSTDEDAADEPKLRRVELKLEPPVAQEQEPVDDVNIDAINEN